MTQPTTDTAPWPGRVTVEISGITDPATFPRLSDALTELWESMRRLPLDNAHYCAYELILARPNSEQHMALRLERYGEAVLSFTLPDGRHLMRLRPTARQ